MAAEHRRELPDGRGNGSASYSPPGPVPTRVLDTPAYSGYQRPAHRIDCIHPLLRETIQ